MIGLIINICILCMKVLIKIFMLWIKAVMLAFSFVVTAAQELFTLSWKNEDDKPKIIKNSFILAGSIIACIVLIWFAYAIFNGGGSSRSYKKSNQTKQSSTIKQTATAKQVESTEIIKPEIKSGWANDSNFPNEIIYYDENLKQVINKDYKIDGNWYHFNENGFMIKGQWNGDYYYDIDGKMATNKWIGDYYVGEDGKYVEQKNKEIAPIIADTNQKINETTINNVQIIQETVPVTLEINNEHLSDNFYIDGKLDTYSETFEIEEDYSSKATIVIPKIAGKDEYKVNRANEFLNLAKYDLIDEVEIILSEESPAYKLLSINNSEVSSQSSNKLRIILSGTLKTNGGTTKKIKYVFTYDADNDNYELDRKE